MPRPSKNAQWRARRIKQERDRASLLQQIRRMLSKGASNDEIAKATKKTKKHIEYLVQRVIGSKARVKKDRWAKPKTTNLFKSGEFSFDPDNL